MNWLKTWRLSDRVWGINVFMWLAIHSVVKSDLLTPGCILNVWRQSHFSVLQQAGLLRIVPRSRLWLL